MIMGSPPVIGRSVTSGWPRFFIGDSVLAHDLL